VVSGAHAGANASQHYDFYFFVRNERVAKHHRQLALSKWHMLPLRRLSPLLIECPHTFLQTQQRLVDLRTLSLSVLIITHAILSPLTSSQIDEQEFAAIVDPLLLNLDLSDGMTATRRIVGLGRMRRTHLIALLDQVKDLVVVVHELLLESSNLDGI